MRPTFLGFETARKSVMASQKALDLTGHNISNVNTPGYSRQRLDVFSVITTSGGSRYASSKVTCAGQGVYAGGVDQMRNPFLDKRFRELNSDTAEAGIKTGIITDVENVLDNVDTVGINKALTEFKGTMSKFATDSTDRTEMANIFAQSAKKLVNVLNTYDTKLQQVQDQTKYEINTTIGDINATVNKIAALNQQIVDSYVGSGQISSDLVGDYTVNASYGPNELLDARNLLIDSLSTYGDVDVQDQNDGSVTIKFAGATVVQGAKSTELSYREDSTTGALVVSFNSGDEYNPKSGSLKGYIETYNGAGCYAKGKQNGTEGIPYYRTAINKFAETIAREFNEANVDMNAPTVARPMFSSSDGTAITAENIRVDKNWLDNPMSILPTTQKGELDNAHIMKLMSVFDKKVTFGDMGDFTGTFSEYSTHYTDKMAEELNFQSGKHDSSLTLTSSIMDERDATSGVSLDEEGINMMNYQKWFNASARLMTTLDESLDKIINEMGRVGR